MNINNLNIGGLVMTTYNYYDAVCEDIRNYIEENTDYIKEKEFTDEDTLRDYLYDEMFVADSVTGNGSGSYTFSTWQAEENICHNLDLLAEACEEFGSDTDILKNGAEACDVTIRCYLLSECLSKVLDEIDLDELLVSEEKEEEEG